MASETDTQIEKFLTNTLTGLSLLYQANLYGQMLVLLYSFIDSAGLLDAPPTQMKASGQTFKNWVKKYMVIDSRINFNETDLWSARCAVLHTFTSQSDLSISGQARELQYYSGPKDSPKALAFVKSASLFEGGKHIPVHIDDTYLVFLEALKVFSINLSVNCASNPAYEQRLKKVLQAYIL